MGLSTVGFIFKVVIFVLLIAASFFEWKAGMARERQVEALRQLGKAYELKIAAQDDQIKAQGDLILTQRKFVDAANANARAQEWLAEERGKMIAILRHHRPSVN